MTTHPGYVARAAAIAVPLLTFQTSVLASLLVLLPALPLLALPSCRARRLFSSFAGQLQLAWFGFAVACLRYGLGTKTFVHTASPDVISQLTTLQDALVVCNHRTRVDWMFLWGLFAAMRRLSGLKIALKSSLRSVPGFGWACQCFGFAFMSRSNRSQDLGCITSILKMHCGDRVAGPVAFLLFPEGTDCSDEQLKRSAAYAAKEGLQQYKFVLHPRTAGFAASWAALCESSPDGCTPSLVNVTIAYVDYTPGERPSEATIFLKGRCPREVHLHIEVLTPSSAASTLCQRLFAEKEARLAAFYGHVGNGQGPDIEGFAKSPGAAKSSHTTVVLDAIPAVRAAMLWGFACMLCLEIASGMLAWYAGLVWAVLLTIALATLFILVIKATGGIDQLLLRHSEKFPCGV
mmetsp:Transcript_50912/g.114525  ORF Transcript_50912/g.114525 Transcript_50912/m.114525 type:complete len:405 (-) Transcript_50912:8-1222(-)